MVLITIMILKDSYSYAQLPSQDSSYAMVFSDDFNDTTLNTNNWQTNAPYGNTPYKLTCGTPQDSLWFLEYYTPGNNLTFTGNSVKLEVKREDYSGTYVDHYDKAADCAANNCPWWGCINDTCYTPDVDTATFKYTSARLWSKKKFKYGYFEIRVKLPDQPTSPATYQGISTNFWLFDANNMVDWSELDIYEIKCNGNISGNNIHFRTRGDSMKFTDPAPHIAVTFNNQYKTFAVNWTPDKIEFYMNDSLMRTSFLKPDSLISMPIYIDMNIDQNQFCERVDTVNTVLPYHVEVDYIKVYQLKTDCNTAKTYCNTIATHDYKTYQSITLDGGSCTDVLNNKPNESFTASDYILFDQGFEAGSNVTAKFDVMNCFPGQDFSDSRIANPPPYEIPPASWFERLIH